MTSAYYQTLTYWKQNPFFTFIRPLRPIGPLVFDFILQHLKERFWTPVITSNTSLTVCQIVKFHWLCYRLWKVSTTARSNGIGPSRVRSCAKGIPMDGSHKLSTQQALWCNIDCRSMGNHCLSLCVSLLHWSVYSVRRRRSLRRRLLYHQISTPIVSIWFWSNLVYIIIGNYGNMFG